MGLIGDLTGGLIGTSSAEKAAKKAKKLSAEVAKENIADFETHYGITEEQFQPYLEAGSIAIRDLVESRFNDPEAPELAQFMYPDPSDPSKSVFSVAPPTIPELEMFQFDPSQLEHNPAYNWRFEQGLEATERALASNRQLGSGNRLTAVTEYGQGMASQEYENEFNRQFATNQVRNQTSMDQYGMDVGRYSRERQGVLDENTRRTSEYGMAADRFRTIMDRLRGIGTQGQTAATNLAGVRQNTVSGVTQARAGKAADIFAANLIPVQERQSYIGGIMDIVGARAGRSG